MTGVATFEAANLDLGLGSKNCVFKLDREIVAQIVAANLPRTSLLSSTHVEHLAEQVAEDVAQVDTAAEATEAARAATAHTRVPKSIVGSALVRIAQHLVRFTRLFELLFCGVIARVAVRVELHCQLAISALQLLVAGFTRNAQNLVVICFAHSRICTHSFFLLFAYSLVCFGFETTRTSAGRNNFSRSLYPRRISSATCWSGISTRSTEPIAS